MIHELDVVSLTHDIAEKNLAKGDTGTVVFCHQGGKAFEVEFVRPDGKTIAVLTLSDRDIHLIETHRVI